MEGGIYNSAVEPEQLKQNPFMSSVSRGNNLDNSIQDRKQLPNEDWITLQSGRIVPQNVPTAMPAVPHMQRQMSGPYQHNSDNDDVKLAKTQVRSLGCSFRPADYNNEAPMRRNMSPDSRSARRQPSRHGNDMLPQQSRNSRPPPSRDERRDRSNQRYSDDKSQGYISQNEKPMRRSTNDYSPPRRPHQQSSSRRPAGPTTSLHRDRREIRGPYGPEDIY